MSLIIGIIILVALNLAWVMIEKRLDAKPSAPNYRPDEGVDDVSSRAVPEVLKEFGVTASSALTTTTLLPHDIRSFFDRYEKLQFDDVIHLDRSYLENPYDENESFVKIGLMGEEEDLLVKRNHRLMRGHGSPLPVCVVSLQFMPFIGHAKERRNNRFGRCVNNGVWFDRNSVVVEYCQCMSKGWKTPI